jgi:hypothetical protein
MQDFKYISLDVAVRKDSIRELANNGEEGNDRAVLFSGQDDAGNTYWFVDVSGTSYWLDESLPDIYDPAELYFSGTTDEEAVKFFDNHWT